jgi:ABC-type dipeptide/oligopeptide/nickel transport system permease subunit
MSIIFSFLSPWEMLILPTGVFYFVYGVVCGIVAGVSPGEVDEDRFVLGRDIFLLFYSLMFWMFLFSAIFSRRIETYCCKFRHVKIFGFILVFSINPLLFLIVQRFREEQFLSYKQDSFLFIALFHSLMYLFFIRRFQDVGYRLALLVVTYFSSHFILCLFAALYYCFVLQHSHP